MENEESGAILSWDDLEDVEEFATTTVELPKLSKRLGRAVSCKIRAIELEDLVTAADFPLDEMNAFAASEDGGEEFQEQWTEHVKSLEVGEMMKMIEKTLVAALVEPKGSEGNLRKLRDDWSTIFDAVMGLTLPKAVVEEAGTFPENGDSGGA